jgi:hypothetical protein
MNYVYRSVKAVRKDFRGCLLPKPIDLILLVEDVRPGNVSIAPESPAIFSEALRINKGGKVSPKNVRALFTDEGNIPLPLGPF